MNKAITFYASKFKLHWKALDNETYRNHISNELSRHNNESHWIEESIMQLCVLKKLIQCGCSIKDYQIKRSTIQGISKHSYAAKNKYRKISTSGNLMAGKLSSQNRQKYWLNEIVVNNSERNII